MHELSFIDHSDQAQAHSLSHHPDHVYSTPFREEVKTHQSLILIVGLFPFLLHECLSTAFPLVLKSEELPYPSKYKTHRKLLIGNHTN